MENMEQKFTRQFKVSILRPGGNDTALIEGIVEKERRKFINDRVMRMFPNVEQVGFYKYNTKNRTAQLEMAGGEFCGNALRSLAYLLLNGKKGKIKFKVTGVNRLLRAGVNKKNTAFAQMPILKNLNSIKKINRNLWLVNLEGISHLIRITSQTLSPNKAKRIAKRLLRASGLLSSRPAAGVMFVKKNRFDSGLEIEPVVWVRDIETFFYETACASGTAAVGLWCAFQEDKNNIGLKIKQPSKSFIQVNVKKNSQKFLDTYIEGPVKILKAKGVISL